MFTAFSMPVRKGRLKSEDEQRIKINLNYLIQEIEANDIVNNLFSKQIFTADDKEEIKNQPSKGKRTEMMLDKLLHSGPGEAYEVFINALKKQYGHVVTKIEETPVERKGPENNTSCSPEAWYRGLPDSLKKRNISDSVASRLSTIKGVNWNQFFIFLETNVSYLGQGEEDPSSFVTAALGRWRQRKMKEATIGNFMKVIFQLDAERNSSVDWKSVQEVMDIIMESCPCV